MSLSLKQYLEKITNGSINPKEILDSYLDTIDNDKLWAYLRKEDKYANAVFEKVKNWILKWAPIAVKDNFMIEWTVSTCASKILKDYVSPYTATCIKNLEKNWGIVIWKTNMDEFAMWGSTENSGYGITLNPYGTNRIPGGTSGWSAVAVANDMCLAALGSDTGWSVRQPASMCWVIWFKPTYGRISRYGVQSMASSLDQVGIFAKTIEDTEIMLNAIMWYDEKDSQSNKKSDEKIDTNVNLKWAKIAVVKELLWDWLEENVRIRFMETLELLKANGAEIEEISLPILKYGIAIYYTLMPAEVSTNLARFDGIRFGIQKETMDENNIKEYYTKIRSEGFGEEAKRRILLWTYVLSSANYEGYYLKAQKARKLLKSEMYNILNTYDLLLSPTSPEVAREIGTKNNDPLKMYLADLYTIPANLAEVPAISIPMWLVEDKWEMMPIGLHMIANKWEEWKLLGIGKHIEKLLNEKFNK